MSLSCPHLAINNGPMMNSLLSIVLEDKIVLSKTLSFLPYDDIKNSRFVSKLWDNEGAFILGQKSHLVLHFLKSENGNDIAIDTPTITGLFGNTPSSVNTLLGRNLNMIYEYTRHPTTMGQPHFQALFRQLKDSVETIHLKCTPFFADSLKCALEENQFAKVRKISITEAFPFTLQIDEGPMSPSFTKFPTTLTILEYGVLPQFRFYGDNNYARPFHAILQELVNKSPSLEKLKIKDNFYPDLSSCTKLKTFEWTGFPYRERNLDDELDSEFGHLIWEDFSIPNLFTMLWQVYEGNPCITKMKIATSQCEFLHEHGCTRIKLEGAYEFPPFAELMNLNIRSMPIFANMMQTITPTRYPKLADFTIRQNTCETDTIQKWIENFVSISDPFENLHTFTTDAIFGKQEPGVSPCFANFSSKLPNLKRLMVKIKERNNNGCLLKENYEQNFTHLFSIIPEIFPGLTHLELHFQSYPLQKLMKYMRINGFKDLKSLTFVCRKLKTYSINFECDNFHETLLAFKYVIFSGFMFPAEVWTNIVEFCKRNNLRVSFF